MTVGEALASAACADARLLLARAFGRSTAWIVAHSDDGLDEAVRARFEAWCARRRAGEPAAYVVGFAGFYGRDFAVDRRVLVPRPETEHLVDEIVAFVRETPAPKILDVGTGSGALAVTLAAECPRASVDAIDISSDALLVARANAVRHGVDARVTFFQGDLLEPVRGRTYDAVVANLPYVPASDIAPAPAPLGFEPRLALDGGPDGLSLYRRLLDVAPAALCQGGILLLEAAPPTMNELAALARAAFPNAEVTIRNDYAGLARYVKVRTLG